MAKRRPRRGPNLPTIQKLRELGDYRERYRKQKGKLPTWISACRQIGINYRTVKRHVPELLERWNDKDFQW
jgi:hypothetical protein